MLKLQGQSKIVGLYKMVTLVFWVLFQGRWLASLSFFLFYKF